jgi:hypothetical protein
MEVDEANYSKGSEDTPQFPIAQDSEKKELPMNRVTMDLNQILALNKNISDSINSEVNNNQTISNNLTSINPIFSSHKKQSDNKKYNAGSKQLQQSLTKLFSPNSRNTIKNSNFSNQMVSPIKESRNVCLDQTFSEVDVKKRIAAYVQIIDDINIQAESEFVETKNHIQLLRENAKEFHLKKEQILKEKSSLENNFDIFSIEELKLHGQIKAFNSISEINVFSILGTENNSLRFTVFRHLEITLCFKEFVKKMCDENNSTLELIKLNSKISEVFIENLNNETKSEIRNHLDEILLFSFGLNKNSAIKLNLTKVIENIKKLIKFSSHLVYLIKCLAKAAVASNSLSFSSYKETSILTRKAQLKLNFISIQGLAIDFKFEIELMNSFYGVVLADVGINNISHQKFSEQELSKTLSIMKEVRNYFENNPKLIFKLRDFIQRIPNFLYK